jgi:Ser/Thr protein kinase RdoA (MazF antagonist)
MRVRLFMIRTNMADYVDSGPELIVISEQNRYFDADMSDVRPTKDPALRAIEVPPPAISAQTVANVVMLDYEIAGRLEPLVSERDQNFRLITPQGGNYVVKIANPLEDPRVTDFQIKALQHLEHRCCPVPVPQVVRTVDGRDSTRIKSDAVDCVLRLVTYLPGEPLSSREVDTETARGLGGCLAELDAALDGFHHPGEQQVLIWDMQRALSLRDLLVHIGDARDRSGVARCLDDFERRVVPRLGSLRRQVIHNDLHGGNVLVETDRPDRISGVIDFGDMMRAPLIIDVAIAAAYVHDNDGNDLEPALALIAGFDAVTPLNGEERLLLYDLMRARLAATITIMNWRRTARDPSDDYLQEGLQNEGGAERFLARLNDMTVAEFAALIDDHCRRNPVNPLI